MIYKNDENIYNLAQMIKEEVQELKPDYLKILKMATDISKSAKTCIRYLQR